MKLAILFFWYANAVMVFLQIELLNYASLHRDFYHALQMFLGAVVALATLIQLDAIRREMLTEEEALAEGIARCRRIDAIPQVVRRLLRMKVHLLIVEDGKPRIIKLREGESHPVNICFNGEERAVMMQNIKGRLCQIVS